MRSFLLTLFLLFFSFFIFQSCALLEEAGGADLSQISERDAGLYCLARNEWGKDCEADGDNPVLYDPNLEFAGLTITYRSRKSKLGLEASRWTIYINPNSNCRYEVLRHEIGHTFGIGEDAHPWVSRISC
ncbi:hypothetical protein LCGC14_0729530 [marine sediment metagenome]|uniref:Uncharacterized protein n=1 Tax=marine sediment metagenome TaxID=412755 RepID=A0A0F9SVA4_9ZZZZ